MRTIGVLGSMVCFIFIVAAAGCINQELPAENLTLSDYPELFGKDVMIVIGSNASGIEIEGADAIVENLFNLTGNMPVIKTDAEITEDELAGHNLIVVGWQLPVKDVWFEIYFNHNDTLIHKEEGSKREVYRYYIYLEGEK